MEKIPTGLSLMCSDNEETHQDLKLLEEIQDTKKGGIHAFHKLPVIISSICHVTLDSI